MINRYGSHPFNFESFFIGNRKNINIIYTMKTLRTFGMVIFAILTCVNFASCSSNEDEEYTKTNEELIIGTWNLVDEDYSGSLTFRTDGTGTATEDRWSELFTWKLSGSTITFTMPNEDGTNDVWNETIKELTDTKLVLSSYEDGEYWTETYRRR